MIFCLVLRNNKKGVTLSAAPFFVTKIINFFMRIFSTWLLNTSILLVIKLIEVISEVLLVKPRALHLQDILDVVSGLTR